MTTTKRAWKDSRGKVGDARVMPLRRDRQHRLPELVPVYESTQHGHRRKTVALKRLRNVSPEPEECGLERTLYRLAWQGQIPDDLGDEGARALAMMSLYDPSMIWDRGSMPRKLKAGPAPVKDMLGLLPPQIPEDLAYWLAVNAKWLPSDTDLLRPVAGLPASYAQDAVNGTFIVDDEGLKATAYLRWLAESHWGHPLLETFDTAVRDELLQIAVVATRCYFFLVGDYLYDAQKQWFDHDGKHLWPEKASYMFWVGRTGRGLYARNAGFADLARPDEAFEAQSSAWAIFGTKRAAVPKSRPAR